jgi:ATP-binding cassette subfamily B protein
VWRAVAYLGHYRALAAGAFLALVAVSAANLATPQMIRLAVDRGLAHREASVVIFAAVGLCVIAALRGLANFLQGYLSERASQGVAFDLREALYARIHRLSFSYYDQAETGQLLTRLTNDVEQVRSFVGMGVIQVAASLLMLVGTATLILLTNPLVALVSLAIIAPIFWLLGRFVRVIGPLFGRSQAALGRLNGVLKEALTGLRVVRAFSGEAREAARYRRVNDELAALGTTAVNAIAWNFPYVVFFANLGTLAVVGGGGAQVLGGHLTIGELLAVQSYLGQLLMPIMTIGFLAGMLARAGASAVRVFELLDAAIDVADRPGAIELPTLTGRLEFRDVAFRYAGAERDTLRGVSFTVEPGQTVALLGTTGAGKSTITHLVPRFYDVTGGAVLVDGHDVRDVTLHSLRAHIGIVLQDTLLVSGTVRENLAYGRPDATREELVAAAQAAQAAEFIEALPEKYDTVIGERGVGLSGGQRQRIAIARTLVTDPRLLILDDSTSAVDAATEGAIQDALDRLMRDRRRTALVIAQRVSTVRDADLVLVIDDGRIAARGTHEELLATSPLYSDILGSQLEGAK